MTVKDSKASADIHVLFQEGVDRANAPQSALDATAANLYKDAEPATLKLTSRRKEDFAVGSGYIADANGEAVTNAHVVLGSKELSVRTSDGQVHQAKIVDMDDIRDLAKIKILDLNASENHWLALSNSPLKPDEKVWGLTHPHGSQELYISPGKFLNEKSILAKDIERIQAKGYSMTSTDFLTLKLKGRSADEAKDIESRLDQSIDFVDAHTEHGSSGGPFLKNTEEIAGLEVTGGYGFSGMIPAKDVGAFLDKKEPKYKFEYENQSNASIWLHQLANRPQHTLAAELPNAFLAGAGLGTINSGRYKLSALSFGILAANDLNIRYDDFAHSASLMVKAEDGIKMLGDSVALVGSAALIVPKVRQVGKLALAAGAFLSTAANFLPSHLVLTKTTRVEGPDRPPTPID